MSNITVYCSVESEKIIIVQQLALPMRAPELLLLCFKNNL